MKRAMVVIIILFISPVYLISASGHWAESSLGYHNGNFSVRYSVNPNYRQVYQSRNISLSNVWSNSSVDLFVLFDYDTNEKNIYLVYTTDRTSPNKTNGTSIDCEFDNYSDPNRWFRGNIPAQLANTEVRYVFYISNDNLSNVYARVAGDNQYETSWSEDDNVYFSYTVNSDQTYHTVGFSGSEDDWITSLEKVGSDGNTNFYLTWDDTYLYTGIFTNDISFTEANEKFNIGLDIDPGGSNGDATNSFGGYNFAANNDGFHKPDYIIQWDDDFTNDVKLFTGVDGSFDTGSDETYGNWVSSDNKNVEVRIPWSDIGNKPTSDWSILLWSCWGNDANVSYSFPTSNPTGDASTPLAVEDYHLYNSANSGMNPSTDGTDQTLPVELSSFTAMLGENGPLLNWTTQSEENNTGWNVYRGETEAAWQQQEVVQLNSAMGLIEGAGTTSEPTDYQFQDIMPTQSDNSYWYWLESVDYSGVTELYGPAMVQIPAQVPVLSKHRTCHMLMVYIRIILTRSIHLPRSVLPCARAGR